MPIQASSGSRTCDREHVQLDGRQQLLSHREHVHRHRGPFWFHSWRRKRAMVGSCCEKTYCQRTRKCRTLAVNENLPTLNGWRKREYATSYKVPSHVTQCTMISHIRYLPPHPHTQSHANMQTSRSLGAIFPATCFLSLKFFKFLVAGGC